MSPDLFNQQPAQKPEKPKKAEKGEKEVKFPIPNDISVSERASLLKKLSETLKFGFYGVFNPKHEEILEKEKKEQEQAKNSQPE